MNYEYKVQATVGKQTKECDVVVQPEVGNDATTPAPRFRVCVDGKDMLVEARRFDERGSIATWTILDAEGHQRLLDLDGALPDLRISVGGGETIQIKINDRRDLLAQSGTLSGPTGSGEVRAAMPGKVVKLLCQIGDNVKPGQGLLIVEAMKMENELRAAVAGKVTAFSVREGQTVEAGQVLVSLSPQKDP
jgi:biotin carboxyl carrier protein